MLLGERVDAHESWTSGAGPATIGGTQFSMNKEGDNRGSGVSISHEDVPKVKYRRQNDTE